MSFRRGSSCVLIIAGCIMKTWVIAVVVSILILNIAVGIAIVCVLVTRLNNEQQVYEGSISSQNFKNKIDKVYTELLGNGHGKPKDETNYVGPVTISSQMANLLKPVTFYTGLNNTGLVKEDVRRVTPARGWAAQTLFNGMQNDHGSISVPVAGVYMVYSHVTSHTDEESDLIHRITTYNAEKQVENIAFQDIVCVNRHNVTERGLVLASDIRGILKLNAGDQLRVDLSRVTQSGFETDWYYFGLHMI